MEGLVERLEQERRREVAALAERHPVSRFPFRGRIQSLIRLRSLRREVATIRHQQRSRKLEAERCRTQSNVSARERTEARSQLPCDEHQTDENSSFSQVLQSDSHNSGCANPVDVSDGEEDHYRQLITTRRTESSPQSVYSQQVFCTPIARHEDRREGRSPDASWDERSLWASDLDWRRPFDSPALEAFCSDAATEGTKTMVRLQAAAPTECSWLSERPSSTSGWDVTRETSRHGSLRTNSMDNGEIRDLLNRSEQQCTEESGEEQCDEQSIYSQNYASSSHQGAAPSLSSSSVVELLRLQQSHQSTSLPLSSQMMQQLERWRSASLPLPPEEPQQLECCSGASSTRHLPPSLQEGEGEVIHGLKDDIGQIQHEISELRRLVDSYLEWQTILKHLIKQEVSTAVTQLWRGKAFHNSKWIPGRKDTCCICCEEQVDSLLYRCGHMCACYKCAQELHWSSGRCPICRSMITDVVRVYQNS